MLPEQELNKRLDISNDGFVRTTEERHHKTVHAVWKRALVRLMCSTAVRLLQLCTS